MEFCSKWEPIWNFDSDCEPYIEFCSDCAKKIWHAVLSNFSTLRLSHKNSRRRLSHHCYQRSLHASSAACTHSLYPCNETQSTVHCSNDAHMMGHAGRAIAYHAHVAMQWSLYGWLCASSFIDDDHYVVTQPLHLSNDPWQWWCIDVLVYYLGLHMWPHCITHGRCSVLPSSWVMVTPVMPLLLWL